MNKKFLYIEDETNSYNALKDVADAMHIDLDRANHVDELIKMYDTMKYDGVIIDARGYKDKAEFINQGDPKPKCLKLSLDHIEKLEFEGGTKIPKAIYTAHTDLPGDTLGDEGLNDILFEKEVIDSDVKMLQMLTKESKETTENKIKHRFPIICKILNEDYYPEDLREKYYIHLQSLVSKDSLSVSAINDAFSDFRKIIEANYNVIQERWNNEFLNKLEGPKDKMLWIAGSPIHQDPYISYNKKKYIYKDEEKYLQLSRINCIAQYLYHMGNAAIHPPKYAEKYVVKDAPSFDLFKSGIYALNEFTVWFGNFIDYIEKQKTAIKKQKVSS